jgi:hypothetical protein
LAALPTAPIDIAENTKGIKAPINTPIKTNGFKRFHLIKSQHLLMEE